MPSHLFVRHRCERCLLTFETRAADHDGRPVLAAPPGWTRGHHKGRDYLVCYGCLHAGGIGAWLTEAATRAPGAATTLHARHACDRCSAVVEADADPADGAPALPRGWALSTFDRRPFVVCAACQAALRAFAADNARTEQSP